MTKNIRLIGLSLAALTFLLSLGCETLRYADDSSFLLGFACLLFGQEYLSWYANLCFIFAGLFLVGKQDALAVPVAALGVGLALSALGIDSIPKNEAGHEAPVIGYGPGFYLWTTSGVVLLLTPLACWLRDRQRTLTHAAAAPLAPPNPAPIAL